MEIKNKQKNKGFTLIELLVVLAVVSLLLSLVFASIANSRRRTQDAQVLSDRYQIQIALEQYSNAHGGYPNVQYSTSPVCIGGTDCVYLGAPVTHQLSLPGFLFSNLTTPTVVDANGLPTKGFIYIPCGSATPTCPTGKNTLLVSETNAQGVQYQTSGLWESPLQYCDVYSCGGGGGGGGGDGGSGDDGSGGDGSGGSGGS